MESSFSIYFWLSTEVAMTEKPAPGSVSVNGRPAKASYDVKVGDRIEIQFGARTVAVEVLQVAENVRKDDAVGMYREITP